MLSDRIGGARVLSGVFAGVVPFALLLMWPSMLPFTVGALGCAALLGARQRRRVQAGAAVLPDQHRRRSPGLVGAMGGLGGFFPPLLLGFFRDRARRRLAGLRAAGADGRSRSGSLNARLFLPRQRGGRARRCRAELRAHGRAAARRRLGDAWRPALLVAAIVVGSRNLQNFDPALVIYTFAVIFATWGIVYHYAVWLNKPPTRRFFERTFELIRAPRVRCAAPASLSTTFAHAPARADVHPQALAPALVDAPAALLGLPARGRDHVPAGVRLDPLRIARPTTR